MGSMNEHLNEDAVQTAMQQKALGQQQAAAPTQAHPQPAQHPLAPDAQPREVGSLQEELLHRPVADIGSELKAFVDPYQLLNINPETDTPEEQAQKKQLHQRFTKLEAEDEQEAKKQFNLRMQQRQQQLKEDQMKQQQQAQAKQTFVVPGGKKDGPVGPGGGKSKKADTMQQMQQQRSSPLSKLQGAN